MIEADLSELAGRAYECLPGCALCCLCQPELLPEEHRRLSIQAQLAERIVPLPEDPASGRTAFALQGPVGACAFLKERRCTIYELRPHFCQQFPVHLHLGWRVQLNADFSCRGLWTGKGESLEAFGRRVLERIGEDDLARELAQGRRAFSEFRRRVERTWPYWDARGVRELLSALVPDLLRHDGIGRVLSYADDFPQQHRRISAREIHAGIRRSEPDPSVEQLAAGDGLELFDLGDLTKLPIFVDRELRWHLFQTRGELLAHFLAEEDRILTELEPVNPAELPLLPYTEEGRAEAGRYLQLLLRRDQLIGHIAYIVDEHGYVEPIPQVALGSFATLVLDFWWRASLLATAQGRAELGPAEVVDGIVAFDMDFLDLPTVGALR